EGWNSWRVSNMGLLNIGRREGSEIIQLFGRGVRLRGREFSLKRSAALNGEHPEHIRLLETLNIFAVRANYMAQFRDYLQREGIEVDGYMELPLPIRPNSDFLNKGLVLPRLSTDQNFADAYNILLAPDAAARITVDLSLKVESMRSQPGGMATVALKSGQEQTVPSESLDLVDWESVYLNLLDYKEKKNFFNLAIPPDVPRKLLEARDPQIYRLIADESIVRPRSFREVATLQEAVVSILRKYTEKYYRVCQGRWESENMAYIALDAGDPNFQSYRIQIPQTQGQLITSIKQLIDEGKRLYQEETAELPNIHFDRHLYQPLLLRNNRITSEPKGLEPSEKRFVEDLRQYVRQEKDDFLADKEAFLLRNLSRGKGVGFFESAGFYPDFILWIKEGDRQRIVFVEPHGMRQEKTYWNSDKTQLH
ncbi:MAG: restriction endonuclease subunit R, partial [bacterium]|nr:restriction endonuclease subunit R [bacterium]